MPEETYYWNYSRHLDIGYLDHPPMVGWLIWLGTAVFGDYGVRRADRRDELRRHRLAVRLPPDPESVRRTERAGGGGAAADPPVLFSDRHAHDAGCAAHRRVDRSRLFPGACAHRRTGQCLVGRGPVPGIGDAVEVHDRPVGPVGLAVHAVRCPCTPLAAALAALWRGVPRIRDLFTGDRLECPP